MEIMKMLNLHDFDDMVLTCPADDSTLKVQNVREIQIRAYPRGNAVGYYVHSKTRTLEIIPTVSARQESYKKGDPKFNEVLLKFVIERTLE